MPEGSDIERGLHERVLRTIDEGNLPALMIDPWNRTILAANQTFQSTFDWMEDKLVSRAYLEIVVEEDHEIVRDLLGVVSFGGDPGSEPVRLLDGEGNVRETRWRGVPNLLRDPHRPVPVICRPTPGGEGTPIGPPESLQEDDEALDIAAKIFKAQDDRKGNHSSSLWRD